VTPLELHAETEALRKRLEAVDSDWAHTSARIGGRLQRLREKGGTLPAHLVGRALDEIG
jgi:hypothetical protein